MIIDDNNFQSHENELAKRFTILDAINFTTQSWDEVTVETISKCFKSSGFNWDDADRNVGGPDKNYEVSLSELIYQEGIKNREIVPEKYLDAFEQIFSNEILQYIIKER